MLASLGRLPCASGSFDCEHDASRCAERKGELMGVQWPTCPFRSVLEDDAIPALLKLERRRANGFPTHLSCGAEQALIELGEQRVAAAEQRARVARMGGDP
jgi:hypothetical protein